MSGPAPIAALVDVHKAWPRPEGGPPTVVLDGVNLTVTPGEAVAIIGPSGSGKTTLLDVLGALEPADRGEVTLGGQSVASLSEDARAGLRARHVGLVFQRHRLLPQCTALENVMVPTLADRSLRAGAAERAAELLDAVGLADRAGSRPGQLSVGQCQRVAVARALINGPQLVLADEPTGALDGDTAAYVAELLLRLRAERGLALVVVTHDLDLAARLDRGLSLTSGKLIG